jgi:hypothetical protein
MDQQPRFVLLLSHSEGLAFDLQSGDRLETSCSQTVRRDALGKRQNWERTEKKQQKNYSLLRKISSSADQVQVSIKINVESEMHVSVSKTLPRFEVLRHGKHAHQSHRVTEVKLVFFLF